MSSTTESGGPTQATTGGTEATAGTWEQAAAQQQAKRQQFVVTVQQRAGGGSSASMDVKAAAARAQACRLEEAMKRQLEVVPTGDLLFHPHPAALHGMSAAQPQQAQQHHPAAPQHFFPPLPAAATTAASAVPQGQHPPQAPQQQLSGLDLPGGSSAAPRSFSPSPLELFGDHPLFGGSSTGGARPGASPAPPHGALLGGLDDDDFLRIPSPPPLPADWEAAPRPGLLFDFDQFDANKRHQVGAGLLWWTGVQWELGSLLLARGPQQNLQQNLQQQQAAAAALLAFIVSCCSPVLLPGLCSALLARLAPSPPTPNHTPTHPYAGGPHCAHGDRDHRHEPSGCVQPLRRLHLADPVCGGERRCAQARHRCVPWGDLGGMHRGVVVEGPLWRLWRLWRCVPKAAAVVWALCWLCRASGKGARSMPAGTLTQPPAVCHPSTHPPHLQRTCTTRPPRT